MRSVAKSSTREQNHSYHLSYRNYLGKKLVPISLNGQKQSSQDTGFSDNGPQYSAEEYEKFSQDYQFEHKTSSPYFPQANGEAERAVCTVKELLEKDKDPHLALLNYHATQSKEEDIYSPSELLMSWTPRTTIPTTRTQRVPRVPDREEVRTRDRRMKQRQKKNFDSHHGASLRTLPVLKTGDRACMDPQKEGTIQSGVAPRSSTEDGSELRRNRKDIIELPQSNVGEQETQTEREQRDHQPLSCKHLHDRVGVIAPLPLDSTSLLSSNIDI